MVMHEEKEQQKESHRMTDFGRTLYSMMVAKGMDHRQDLVSALNERGYSITQSRLSYYLNGERNVNWLFVECVTALLELNKEEQRRLAWVYAYGQRKPGSEADALIRSMRGAVD